MEEMRPLPNGGPVKSNFPNYGDGAMCQLPRQTCQPIGVVETESVNSLM